MSRCAVATSWSNLREGEQRQLPLKLNAAGLMHGWLVIDKPVGPGSTDVVSRVKRALRDGGYAKLKVGHGGTLDPLASGVLPVALGEATKLAGRMLDADKVYEFTIRFGEETDTLDAEGAVVATSEVRPTLAQVEAVLERFTGEIEQVPPAYSALKVEGKRAYDLARAGEAVEMKSRPVRIHSLTVRAEPVEAQSFIVAEEDKERASTGSARTVSEITLEARVSKGTYIRSLARDIARALETRRPRHHVAQAQGRALHPPIRDFAGQNGRTR